MLVAILSFTLASVLIVLLPGPDSLVVVRGLVRDQKRGGAATAAGVLCGLVVCDGPMAPARVLGGSGFFAGFLTDLLNPKVGVFFVSFLPGFVPDGYPVGWTTFALGAWFTVLTAVYFLGLIAVSGTVSAWMRSPRIRRRLDALTGVVILAFGIRLATES